MDLTIQCAVDSADTLEVFDTGDGRLAFEANDGGFTIITIDQESATRLRDALTDWLEEQL